MSVSELTMDCLITIKSFRCLVATGVQQPSTLEKSILFHRSKSPWCENVGISAPNWAFRATLLFAGSQISGLEQFSERVKKHISPWLKVAQAISFNTHIWSSYICPASYDMESPQHLPFSECDAASKRGFVGRCHSGTSKADIKRCW